MSFSRLGCAVALIVSCSVPAAAQSVSIQFHDGLVTVKALDAPLRTILAEWARVSGAKIVNGERVAGAPVTLELMNAPERQALDVLLRGVSGYIVGARTVASTGTSVFDRILILPTSAVIRTAAAAQPTFTPPPAQFFFEDDPEENPANDIAPGSNQSGPATPAQVQQRLREAVSRASVRDTDADEELEDQDDQPEEAQAPATRPGNPFGAIRGSSRPGEITPVPQRGRNPRRPNGDPEP